MENKLMVAKKLLLPACLIFFACSEKNNKQVGENKNIAIEHIDKLVDNLNTNLDSLKGVFNYIHIPVSEQYNLSDSIINSIYKIKLYRLSSKNEYLTDIYVIQDLKLKKTYIVPSEYHFSGKYYASIDQSDLLLTKGEINPAIYAIFFKNLERFYNDKYADKEIKWNDIININNFFLNFYHKKYMEYGTDSFVTNKDTLNKFIYNEYGKLKFEHKTVAVELQNMQEYLLFKIANKNVNIFCIKDDSRIYFYELYRDKNDTLNKFLLFNYKFFERDYFDFKDIVLSKMDGINTKKNK